MRRRSFRAMGTTIRIVTDDDDDDASDRAILETFREEERRFSRFRSDSELSRVNAHAGPVQVSSTFASVIRMALAAAEETDGAFDPTVLGALEALGYDRNFDEVLAGARAALRPPMPCGRWREVAVEEDVVTLPPGVGLDLGGFVKGWTADAAATRAVGAGRRWALVNAGGDLRIAGDAPSIRIGVEDPDDPATDLGCLVASGGGIATSSVRSRSWGPGRHHLIDPRTGRAADTGFVQVTAVASTCAQAEVRAKAILLSGRASDATVAVDDEGRVLVGLPLEAAA